MSEAREDDRPLRVVIADDHEPMRALLRDELQGAGLEVVGAAADGVEAVELATSERPDVCILDVGMPRMSGLEAARRISTALPRTRILMLTVAPNDEDAQASAGAGAHGYVGKDVAPGRLPSLAHAIAAGGTHFPDRSDI
jgi:DNA-binding NarL/FixJ family response regulator